MTKLVVNLSGEAEVRFKELLSKTNAEERDVVLDALALLHHAVSQVASGKKVGTFNPESKEFQAITLASLNLTKSELQNVLDSYLADNPEAEREMADEFQVAVSTVKRWQNGTARPHPKLVQLIVDYVKSKIRQ